MDMDRVRIRERICTSGGVLKLQGRRCLSNERVDFLPLSRRAHSMYGGPRFCINYTAIITDRVAVREEETGRQRQRER